MKNIFDDTEIGFECPECGHEFREKIGRLQGKTNTDCISCGVSIAIDGDELLRTNKGFTEGIEKVYKAFDRISNKR